MKGGRRKYLIVLIILVIYFVAMFFLLSNKEVKETTIVIDNYAVFKKIENEKWKNILISNYSLEKYNWKKYDVYINNTPYKSNYLMYNDKWYIFDKNKEPINYSTGLLGINTNNDYKIKVANINEENITDYSYVYNVLREKNITIDNNYTVNTYFSFDIDNDNQNEDFYIISNSLPIDFSSNIYYSFIFMVKNNKIYYILDNTYKNMLSSCKPYVSSMIDIDNDKTYEMIINCGKYSNNGADVYLYKFNKNRFEELISNK